MREFFASFQAAPGTTPHTSAQTLEKDHGWLKTRRCYAFDQLDCLYKPEQWPELKSFVVLESERQIKGKTSIERSLYLSSLPADAQRLLSAIRAHWSIKNRLHWCMDAAHARRRAETLLSRLNISERLWSLAPGTFSGGEQQRVNIARGFMVNWPALLLDEPTASLDDTNRRVVLELIEEAKAEGSALIGIFHDEKARTKVASRLLDMESEEINHV
ncbi:hypothetical protein FACS1894116_03090 [Betaproteobacteria bacterium]|nr:hypothetical protein FACS1894116_03090 [Betaproteobacteria bacterium]